jgi:rubrerythrin
MAPLMTRREALGSAVAALALASCGGGDPPPTTGPPAGSGAALLGSLLALEHAALAAYAACAEALDGRARDELLAIRAQERGHAARLARMVTDLGGDPPPGRSREEYAHEFPRLASGADALRFAEDLKERQVRAYLDALTQLPERDLRLEAARICADEGSHLGAIRVLRGLPAAQGPFVTGAL